MICRNCSAEIPNGQRYCGKCGAKAQPESLEELQSRLSSIETLLEKQNQKRVTEQKILDLETSEQVVTRIMKWAKLFAFFVGLPTALIVVALAVVLGKSAKDLADVASDARETVRPLLEQARSDAETAKETAAEALRESKEVRQNVESTKQALSELRNNITARTEDVHKLARQIDESHSEVARLQTSVVEGSNQIRRLSQQVETVNKERNVMSVREAYPVFGERVAGWREGWIDASQKEPQEIYIALMLAVDASSGGRLDADKVGQIMMSLKNEENYLFLGPVGLHATSGRTSQGITQFDEQSCSLAGITPPCILYFRQVLKDVAVKIGALVGPAQVVPEDRIRYVESEKLALEEQELLRKSGLDVVVVLGGR